MSEIINKNNIREYIGRIHRERGWDMPAGNRKNVADFLKKLLFAMMGRRWNWKVQDIKIDVGKIKRVLILRYDAIGDYIVTTTIIRALKELNPRIEVDFISSYRNDMLIKRDPNTSNSWPINQGKILSKANIKSIRAARRENYELVFAMNFTKVSKAALLASIIAPRAGKISLMHKSRKDIYGLVFDRQFEYEERKHTWPEVFGNLLRENFSCPADLHFYPYIFIRNDIIEKLRSFINLHGLIFKPDKSRLLFENEVHDFPLRGEGKKYIIINVAAFDKGRVWNKENYIELIKKIILKYKDLIIFVSADSSSAVLSADICKAVGDSSCIPLVQGLELYIAILTGARLIVSPDSAPVHIAAAAGLPVVALYQERIKPLTWRPHGVEYSLLVPDEDGNINKITPDEVLTALLQLSKMIDKNI